MAALARLSQEQLRGRGLVCSPGDDPEDDDHSPTDASEDSVEVKVTPILALSKKNKRKLAEPRKVAPGAIDKVPPPPTKRPRRGARTVTTTTTEIIPVVPSGPFRPWSDAAAEEPLSLVLRPIEPPSPHALCGAQPTVPSCDPSERRRVSSKFSVESLLGESCEEVPARASTSSVPAPPSSVTSSHGGGPRDPLHPSQRNYKNMTRERRIEANARERTRVHTISAAFDTLRHAIPAYSHSQKLSKLSILRIACSYIVALSRVAGQDYSAEQNSPSLADCVAQVSRTIHAEGKVRKKKDE